MAGRMPGGLPRNWDRDGIMQTDRGQLLGGKALAARQFARCVSTYDGAAIVQLEMARRLVDMIQRAAEPDRLANVLELGCGTGLLSTLLVREFPVERLVLNDMAADLHGVARRCVDIRPALRIEVRPGDMEAIALPADQDLVAASAALHWTSDPCATLQRMLSALKPRGVLAVATFGPDNLQETRSLTGRSLHYYPLSMFRSRLSRQTDVLECYEQRRTVWFESAFAVLQHLKRTGVNSLRQQHWSPSDVKAFCRVYESRFGTGNGVPLTYHPIAWVARRREVCQSDSFRNRH